jgi:hypothetical protein
VVAVARERVPDRATVVLGDHRDAVGDHPLDLRALELGRILGIRKRRQLRLEPLDQRHQQVRVRLRRLAHVHAPTPA